MTITFLMTLGAVYRFCIIALSVKMAVFTRVLYLEMRIGLFILLYSSLAEGFSII